MQKLLKQSLPLIPVLDLPIPTCCCNPTAVPRVPLGIDADCFMGLDVPVGFARLPVPKPDLSLPISRDNIPPIWREARLARIACNCVTLHAEFRELRLL